MRLAALSVSVVVALGLSACGGDDSEVSDVVPKSVPELTVGADAGLPAAPERSETDTTDTTSTTDTTDTTATGATPAAPTPAAPTTTQQQSAPATGGAPADGTATQQGQDDGSGSGGFSDFCEQNPGACPGN